MKDIEKFGAEILLAQIAAGGVVWLGTIQPDPGRLALFAAAVVAVGFTFYAMLFSESTDIAVGVSYSTAPLAVLYCLTPEAVFSLILLGIYASISFVMPALAAWLMKNSQEAPVQRYLSAVWIIGGLKYLNARFWQFWGQWVHRGAR